MSDSGCEMRKVGLDFVESAEKVYVMQCELEAPRAAVFAAFAAPTTWSGWFPGVEKVVYRGDKPYGVGTRRESSVGGAKYQQTMLAWDEDTRWGYVIDRSTVPIAKAQLEITEFEEAGSGTRVRWTLATDPLPDLEFMADGTPFGEFLQSLFKEAMSNLDALLAARG